MVSGDADDTLIRPLLNLYSDWEHRHKVALSAQATRSEVDRGTTTATTTTTTTKPSKQTTSPYNTDQEARHRLDSANKEAGRVQDGVSCSGYSSLCKLRHSFRGIVVGGYRSSVGPLRKTSLFKNGSECGTLPKPVCSGTVANVGRCKRLFFSGTVARFRRC